MTTRRFKWKKIDCERQCPLILQSLTNYQATPTYKKNNCCSTLYRYYLIDYSYESAIVFFQEQQSLKRQQKFCKSVQLKCLCCNTFWLFPHTSASSLEIKFQFNSTHVFLRLETISSKNNYSPISASSLRILSFPTNLIVQSLSSLHF